MTFSPDSWRHKSCFFSKFTVVWISIFSFVSDKLDNNVHNQKSLRFFTLHLLCNLHIWPSRTIIDMCKTLVLFPVITYASLDLSNDRVQPMIKQRANCKNRLILWREKLTANQRTTLFKTSCSPFPTHK